MPQLEQVLEQNPNNVKVVFKNMPLRFHKFADPSARAALAAGEQGKFWEFHDELFKVEKLSDQAIRDIAVKLGLDMGRYEADMNSPAIKQQVSKDISDAQKAGVTGTPTVFINGQRLKNRSPQGFQALINEALKNK